MMVLLVLDLINIIIKRLPIHSLPQVQDDKAWQNISYVTHRDTWEL